MQGMIIIHYDQKEHIKLFQHQAHAHNVLKIHITLVQVLIVHRNAYSEMMGGTATPVPHRALLHNVGMDL